MEALVQVAATFPSSEGIVHVSEKLVGAIYRQGMNGCKHALEEYSHMGIYPRDREFAGIEVSRWAGSN